MNPLKILFVCTGNACRSQMAEGWARTLKAEAIEPWSAGVIASRPDRRTEQAMKEAGVDISAQRPKTMKSLRRETFDAVIAFSVHARLNCPEFEGNPPIYLVEIDDPPSLALSARTPEEVLVHYRRIRDEVRDVVEGLPESLEGLAP